MVSSARTRHLQAIAWCMLEGISKSSIILPSGMASETKYEAYGHDGNQSALSQTRPRNQREKPYYINTPMLTTYVSELGST